MVLGAVQHPLGGPALVTLVVTERHRVARLARVRELVLVAQDALFLSLAVVTGLASADVTKTAIIVAGLAGAVAGALSESTAARRSEEDTSELQSLMRRAYSVFCLEKKKNAQGTRIQ